jgi:hypothetical protein
LVFKVELNICSTSTGLEFGFLYTQLNIYD